MEKNKNSFDSSDVKVDFIEEVSENQLHDKKNHDDIIYKKTFGSIFRARIILIFVSLLFLASLFALVFSFVFPNNVGNGESKMTVHDLYVTHSHESYGGNIESFQKFSSLNNAYVYSFNVTNSGSITLNYKVQLENLDFDSNEDYTSINYILLNNQEQVVSGKLKNNKKVTLGNIDIPVNSVDKLSLKLWVSDNNDVSYKFKVNVIG